jgi:hypothetical protein
MSDSRTFCSLLLKLVVIASGLGTQAAWADTIYAYTGNPFNEFFNGGQCPPDCSVTGWFIVATPLAPNLPETTITPPSFSLSSGGITLTTGDPLNSSLSVGTDASGAIIEWSWVEVGPADNPDARILTESVSGGLWQMTFVLATIRRLS